MFFSGVVGVSMVIKEEDGLGKISTADCRLLTADSSNPTPQAASTSSWLLQPGALLPIVTEPFGLARYSQMLCTSQVDKE